MTKKHILILNGPNINMLHQRDNSVYGDSSLQTIELNCNKVAQDLNLKLTHHQSNFEGEIVETIQQAVGVFDGIIINAAGYTHTSVAIRDALEIFKGRKIEVHISNIYKREEFRHHSYVSAVVDAVIAGLGPNGYIIALLAMNDMLAKS